MTRADLAEISATPPEETGRCMPYKLSGITPESCRLRKAYALKSEDPEVKRCVTCTGIKYLRKTKQASFLC